MNTLTDKERNGLEDVFLSINKKKKTVNHHSIIVSYITLNYRLKYIGMLKKVSKLPKLAQFFTKKTQKKKNLSK